MEKRPTVKKKKRNFSETEMETLVSLVDANRLVLFGSLKAGIKGKQKNAIWKEITVAVNSVSNVRRATEEVC